MVEDDLAFGTLIQTWLKKKGFDVVRATSVKAALQLLNEDSKKDLILSDLRLPDHDGLTLLNWIQKHNMPIPFIVMTSYAEVQNAVLAMKSGATDYIAKPFHTEALQAVIGINGNTSEKPSDQKLNTVIPEQFRQLTAFADDDEEAALEIIKNVKLALNEHLQRLQNILDEANNPTTNAADTPDIKSSITPIKQVVHKILPIATMMQMKSLDQLTALTPENIDKLDDRQIREHLQTIMTDLHNILQDK